MNVTVPHRQKGSALSSLRFAQGQALSEAKDLSAERDRPFASLRVTRWDGCNCEGLFFTTEPCLKEKIMNDQQKTLNNRHAVVIGASMAGLLAARVLSDHFEQVTIIERDRLSDQVEPRKGVPQGRHVHLLLMKGETILRELFPALYETFAQDGAVPLTSADVQWYDFGVWKAPSPDSIKAYCGSRPFLEQYVRRFLAARANVRFIDGCEVNRLCANEDHTRVMGVSLVHHSPVRQEEDLAADLVVDASGRGSRAPQWLMSLGYDRVEETSVKVDVGYATRIYRRPSDLPLDWKLLIIFPTPPHEKRSGLVFPIEDDCWMVSLAGP